MTYKQTQKIYGIQVIDAATGDVISSVALPGWFFTW